MKSLTWGVMPTLAEFNKAFDETCPDGLFRVTDDKAVVTRSFNRLGLHEMIKSCVNADDFSGHDAYEDFASAAMATLGFEWI